MINWRDMWDRVLLFLLPAPWRLIAVIVVIVVAIIVGIKLSRDAAKREDAVELQKALAAQNVADQRVREVEEEWRDKLEEAVKVSFMECDARIAAAAAIVAASAAASAPPPKKKN